MAVSLVWVVSFGQRLLPDTSEQPKRIGPNLRDLEKTYAMGNAFYRLRVRSDSDMVGKQLDALDLRDRWGVNIVGVAYPGTASFRPWSDLVLEADHEIIATGKRADVLQMGSIHHLEPKGSVSIFELARLSPADMELAEMMIPPYSPLVGKTLEELNFREIYHLNVLAILRSDKASAHKLFDTPLMVGDRLLVEGVPQQLIALREGNTMVVLSDLGVSSEDLISKRSLWMLYILAGVVLLSLSGLVALPIAALLGAFASVLLGCTSAEGAYEDVDWPILILVAALLPLGAAITDSGLATAIGAP